MKNGYTNNLKTNNIMTLKEKFLPFVDDIDLINDIPNKEWGLRNAGKCIEIAEEFAIGFAEYLKIDVIIDLSETHTTKELLEIYKKEIRL